MIDFSFAFPSRGNSLEGQLVCSFEVFCCWLPHEGVDI